MKSTFKTNMVPTSNENEGCLLPIGDKYLLTIKEVGAYFNIGVKKMRRLAEDNLGVFSVYSGNRYLVIRPKSEEYLCNTSTI